MELRGKRVSERTAQRETRVDGFACKRLLKSTASKRDVEDPLDILVIDINVGILHCTFATTDIQQEAGGRSPCLARSMMAVAEMAVAQRAVASP